MTRRGSLPAVLLQSTGMRRADWSPMLTAIVIACLCILSVNASAQGSAVLHKKGSSKRITFESGDEIRFMLNGEDHFRKNHIVSVSDSGFQFHYYFIKYSEIAKVDIRKRKWGNFNWNSAGTMVQIAGLGYIAIDTFNKTVVQGDSFEFDNTLWITGGSIFLVGTIMRFFRPRKVAIGRRYGLVYRENYRG